MPTLSRTKDVAVVDSTGVPRPSVLRVSTELAREMLMLMLLLLLRAETLDAARPKSVRLRRPWGGAEGACWGRGGFSRVVVVEWDCLV